MISDIAWMGRHPLRRRRAPGPRGQSPCWTLASVLLLACACGSEGSRNTPPLPSDPPDATPHAPTPADNSSSGPDAGTGERSSDQPLPADASVTSDEPAASDGPAVGIDLELACSSGQAQTICLDDERVVLCVGGSPIETACSALCDTYGRNPGPCDDGCQCGEPSNLGCVKASEDFCACTALTGNDPCTPETADRLYLGCHVNGIGGELMACTADFRATRPEAPVDEAFCAGLNDACN